VYIVPILLIRFVSVVNEHQDQEGTDHKEKNWDTEYTFYTSCL